jgi:Family of unknown function (DUF5906)
MASSAKPRTYGNPPRALQEPLARHIKDLCHWVVWQWALRDDGTKWTKPPFIATSPDKFAKNNDPATWRSYDQACIAVENGEADGIGFCLRGTDIGAFDIDNCRNPETKEIHPFALDLVARANSYTETTPSGTGLRIIGTVSKRYLHRKLYSSNSILSVEFYRNCERYITISNAPLEGVTTELNDIDALLDTVLDELEKRKRPGTTTPQWDDSVIEEAATVDLNLLERFLENNIDLISLVRDGVRQGRKLQRGERSEPLMHAVGWLKDLKWSVAEILALLLKYPTGIADKYLSHSIDRLSKETQRCYHKAREVEPNIADDDTDDNPPQAQSADAQVDKLNETYALVIVGDKTAIMKNVGSDIRFLTVSAFEQWHQNRHVRRNDRKVPLGKYWLTHPQRRQYEGITFSPAREAPAGHFNLWRGFSVEPKPGDCSKVLKHIEDNVCRGDTTLYNWVVGWFAQIVQQSNKKMGTSLVLRGKQGTGKTKVGEVIGSLLGPHYQPIADPRYITGRFNSHLVSCLLLHADEAFWAGDHAAEGKLKDLVTGLWQQIEFKGKETIRIRNYVRLFICGNPDWLVPAGFDERRSAVLDMGEDKMQDKAYFAAIDAEMDNGGREALLHHLLNFDLTTVDLRTIPKTEALVEQQISSLTSEQSWWLDTLMRGELPWGCDYPNSCPTNRLFDRYITRATRQGARRRAIETQLGGFLRKQVPGLERSRSFYKRWNDTRHKMVDQRGWVYDFPPLKDCRAAFAAKMGAEIKWNDADDDWELEPPPDPNDNPNDIPF